jgi:hypothetical protein
MKDQLLCEEIAIRKPESFERFKKTEQEKKQIKEAKKAYKQHVYDKRTRVN